MTSKHTGTEYNAVQRLDAAALAYKLAQHLLSDAEWELEFLSPLPTAQAKRKHTTATRRLSRAKQRLSLACTYWLQHNPLKGT